MPFLRVLLIAQLTGYFSFLFLAYLIDRRLTAFCRARGITKSTRFVAASYVSKEHYIAVLTALKAKAADRNGFIWWLKVWRFGSDVFLVLMVVFVCLALASMTNFRPPNLDFTKAILQPGTHSKMDAALMSNVRPALDAVSGNVRTVGRIALRDTSGHLVGLRQAGR